MLKNVEIETAISVAQTERSVRTQVTQDMIVAELARIGFSDVRKMMTDKGALLHPHEWDDDSVAAISYLDSGTQIGSHIWDLLFLRNPQGLLRGGGKNGGIKSLESEILMIKQYFRKVIWWSLGESNP